MGNPLYCASCEFAASDIDDLERHIRARHAPASVPGVPRNETRDEAWWRKTFDEYQANSEALIDDLRRQLLTLRRGVSSRVELTELPSVEDVMALTSGFGMAHSIRLKLFNAITTLHDAASHREPSEPVTALYNELLYAVAQKFDGETRHQTALRYIRQAEKPSNNGPQCSGRAPSSGGGE